VVALFASLILVSDTATTVSKNSLDKTWEKFFSQS